METIPSLWHIRAKFVDRSDSLQTCAAATTRVWLIACRPQTLPAAVAPVLVGTACAHAAGRMAWLPALAALVAAILLQIAANLANDVLDHARGADNDERLGPTRVVQAGLLSARAVLKGVVVSLSLALLVGCYLAWVGGWPIVAIGLGSMLAAVAYTGGPYPLGYHGLGDLFVLVFFGLIAVTGTAYVQAGDVPALAYWAWIPIGALSTAILVVNNLRDLASDARSGKRTLAVRWGRSGALLEYHLLLAVAYVVPVVLIILGLAGVWVVLPLVTAPVASRLALQVSHNRGGALNQDLARTAQLLLAYAVTFATGIVLDAMIH
ncbi:1,4-dihydroxy-2-naphthoate polyprenyltransferase [Myxococcota bacterium]